MDIKSCFIQQVTDTIILPFYLFPSLQGKSHTPCALVYSLYIYTYIYIHNIHTYIHTNICRHIYLHTNTCNMYACIPLYTTIQAILWVLELDTLCSYFTGRRPYFVIKSNLSPFTGKKASKKCIPPHTIIHRQEGEPKVPKNHNTGTARVRTTDAAILEIRKGVHITRFR